MITKIELKNVASYKDTPAVLETDKKINLIYGLNGTGKTTISRYLQDKNNSKFSDCNIEGYNGEKILVYNQDFIRDVFWENDNIPGIFSLGKENKEAKNNIENAQKEREKLNLILNNDNQTGLNIDLKNKEYEIEKLDEKYKDLFWKIKEKYDTPAFSFCLDGYKSDKKKLCDNLLSKRYIEDVKELNNLEKESLQVLDDNAEKIDENLISKIDFDFGNIETDEIFTTAIVGSKDSEISKFIEQFNNTDWVKKGLDEYTTEPNGDENETCPFCHKKTISKEFYNKLKNYFDKTYQENVNQIDSLYKNYSGEYEKIQNLDEELLKIQFIKDKEKDFKLLLKIFKTIIENNLTKIKEKKEFPSNIVNLQSSEDEKNKLNEFLDEIIEEIKAFNKKIENKKDTKENIKTEFWNIMRNQYNDDIKLYQDSLENLRKEQKKIQDKIDEIDKKIIAQENIIKENQKKIVTIQEAIDNIKEQLLFFGIDGFTIVPSENGNEEYKLQRNGESNTEFQTLSEGEKTVISFLYFIEMCKGKQDKEETSTKKIVVIDDPISSLSHMFLFNIAQLINQQIFNNENFEQIFILTHNLYFFHELIIIGPKGKDESGKRTQKTDCGLFRVLKDCGSSSIKTMKQSEIKNDYENYWEIIKENNQDEGKYSSILANTMRNVLEYFFGFMLDIDSLNNILQEINKEQKYQYFVRYIQRESHNDLININDMKDIDTKIFQEAFKKIFYDTKYNEHYDKMMS